MIAGLVSGSLFRGELRAQGLVSARRWVSVVQGVGTLVVLALLTVTVRGQLTSGSFTNGSMALVTVGAFGVVVFNVLTVSESTNTTVAGLRQWARPLPLTSMQVRSVIAMTGVGRAFLFTVTFLGSAVVAVAAAGMGPAAIAQAVVAMLVLPVLPVAIGLRIGATKRGQIAPVYALVPMALAILGALSPIEVSRPALATVAEVLALPEAILLGLTPTGVAASVLAGWLAAALIILVRLDSAPAVDPLALRPPLADRLASGPSHSVRIAADIVLHRVRASDVALTASVGLLVGVAVIAVTMVDRASYALPLAIVGALPAAFTAYAQATTATTTADRLRPWLAVTPLPASAITLVQHAARSAASAVATAPIMIGVSVATVLTHDITHAFSVESGAAVCLHVAVGVFVVTGWLGLGQTFAGWRKLAIGWFLCSLVLIRCVGLIVMIQVGISGELLVATTLSDLVAGTAGHLLLVRRTMR